MTEAEREYRSIWTELRQVAFRQAWVDVNGISTRFAEAGDPGAPPVVMLHGTGGHWETFAANLGPFSKHFRCLALDAVGNGFSDKPDASYDIAFYIDHLLGFMEELGVTRASFLGTSLGSWVAAKLALDHPERVDKLVFMATAGLMATAENMERIKAQRHQAVDDPSWPSIKAMFDHLLAEEHSRIPDLVGLRQAVYRLPEMKQAIDHILVLQEPDVRDRNLIPEDDWRRITAPALVIASGKDYNEYQSTSRRVVDLMPNAQILEMPHVKHWPHWEDPVTYNEAAIRFLLS